MSSPMSAASVVALVTRREFLARVRTKMFVISTVLLILATAGFALVLHLVSGRDTSVHVGLVPAAAASAQPLQSTAQAVGVKLRTSDVPDQATGERQLRDGELDALVLQVGGTVQVAVKKQLDEPVRGALTVLARQVAQDKAISAAGADPAQVNSVVAAAGVQVRSLEGEPRFQGERIVLAFASGILVYLSLMIYGQTVAQGVIEEKTSRVVELLLAAIRPWQLMLGKVLGIGAAGLLQLVLVTGIGLAAALGLNALSMPSSVAAGAVVWTVIWYLLGFLMYALLFAAAGALVSRQEDAGGVTAPILMLIIFPYIIGISVLPSAPDNGFVHALSLVPLFSPTLMPVRIALGVVPAWEMVLTVALALAITAALVSLAGRVYGNSVVRTGARVRVRDALKPL